MKSTMIAVALLGAAVSFNAEASLFCKNDLGQSLEWKWGHARPNTSPAVFDTRNGVGVVCFVNGFALTFGVPQIGLQRVPVISEDSTSPGVVYNARDALFLIYNLPALSGSPATLADFNAITP